VYEKSETDSNEALAKLCAQTEKESGVPTDFINRKGNIYELTDKVAMDQRATLIIAGLESHMDFKHIIGASASKFVRKAPCPVITIRGQQHNDGCENILLPIDLSPESREKVDVAIQFAKYFGASIRILGLFDEADQAYENELLAYTYQVKLFIKNNGISCTNKSISTKDIATTVVEYANKIEADLIMIMNKPSLSVGEFFKGTDAQKIVDISNVPVMTIQPMEREPLMSFGTGF
jgi:nucleotide-binding universal stress UspA family protein